MTVVLDSWAVLTMLQHGPGAELVASALPAPGSYQRDPKATVVRFAIRELGFSIVHGRFTGVAGSFQVARRVEDSTVTAEIAMATLRTGIRLRDAQLLGPRFLDAAAHPVLRFTATRLRADQGPWTAPGRLEVRGISRPVELRLAPIRHTGDGAVVLRATASPHTPPDARRSDVRTSVDDYTLGCSVS